MNEEQQNEAIARWLAKPKRKGAPSCLCGFIGASRTIMAHRLTCQVWAEHVRSSIKASRLTPDSRRV